jgi:hypothetical protein
MLLWMIDEIFFQIIQYFPPLESVPFQGFFRFNQSCLWFLYSSLERLFVLLKSVPRCHYYVHAVVVRIEEVALNEIMTQPLYNFSS